MSGMMDSIRIMGMFKLVFSAFAEVLLRMYPRAKWPTANNVLSLLGNKKMIKVINLYPSLGIGQPPGLICWLNGCRHSYRA
jgi:hypothetical protein